MAREIPGMLSEKYGDYGSEFEYDSEAERKRQKRADLLPRKKHDKTKLPSKEEVTTEYNRDEGRKMRMHLLSLDAYARHKKFINDYMLYYGGCTTDFKRDSSRDRTDMDVIQENHRFLWHDEDDAQESWEKRLAKKYYDKLYKEYCITDLTYFKHNKIAMRWRTEKEVIEGKGQFVCGAKKCDNSDGLRTWEVNFAYVEHGEKKNALVKLRLCPECSYKLNYRQKKREIIKKRNLEIEEKPAETKKPKSSGESEPDQAEASKKSEKALENSESRQERQNIQEKEESIWEGPAKFTEEKSREEEFEDYFEDMFL